MRTALAVAAALGLCAPALAGPPLVADDPNTIGPGRVQAIAAMDVLASGGDKSLAPTLDLTFGVFERLDATLVANPIVEVGSGSSTQTTEFVEVGAKWQAVDTAEWNAGVSPALGVTFDSQTDFGITLPGQIEYTGWRGFALGVDGGLTLIPGTVDEWEAATYTRWKAAEGLALLGEVWGLGTLSGDEAIAGTGIGLDWAAFQDVHLLGSAGTGIASQGTSRVDWYTYVGLQWTFDAW